MFGRISLLWRLEMRVTMRMMDGERKTGDSLRSSLTVDSYLCEVFLEIKLLLHKKKAFLTSSSDFQISSIKVDKRFKLVLYGIWGQLINN